VLLPNGADRWAILEHAVSFAVQPASFSPGRSQPTALTVLHDRPANPINSRITTNRLVRRVDHDNFVVLVHGVLVNPVRVEHSKVSALSAGALFSDGALVASKLELGDSLVFWLSVLDSLGNGALAATTANADAVDYKALLGFVPEAARFVRASGAGRAVHSGQMTVLPRAHAQKEPHHVRLLLAP